LETVEKKFCENLDLIILSCFQKISLSSKKSYQKDIYKFSTGFQQQKEGKC